MKYFLLKVSIGCVAALFSTNAFAWTDCQVKISATFVGQGIFWMELPGQSGQAYFSLYHAEAKPMMAAALATKIQGLSSAIRFSADGVNCIRIGKRGDVVGIWIP